MKSKADLSHYDLREQFDRWEVACLIAGYEPSDIRAGDDSSVPGKVQFFRSLLEEAYQGALYNLRLFGRGTINNEDTGEAYEFVVGRTSLPSVELWEAYDYIAEHQNIRGDGFSRDAYTDSKANAENPKFWRKDIEQWLCVMGYRDSGYFAKPEQGSTSAPTQESLSIPRQESAPVHDNEEIAQLRAEVARLKEQLAAADSRKDAPPNSLAASDLSFPYITKGLKLVAEVQKRYLGEQFDPQIPDSRPLQESIKRWLKEDKGIESEKEAEAIDRIAMPFERGKTTANPKG